MGITKNQLSGYSFRDKNRFKGFQRDTTVENTVALKELTLSLLKANTTGF